MTLSSTLGRALGGIAAAITALTGCTVGPRIVGSGIPGTAERPLPTAVTTIRQSGTITLVVVPAEKLRLTVSGDDNLLDLVVTSVSGDVLEIGNQPGVSFSSRLGLTVRVEVPAVTTLVHTGVGDLDYAGFKLDTLTIEHSGTGKAHLAGSAGSARFALSGVGSIDAGQVILRGLDADLSGAGEVRVKCDGGDCHAVVSGVGSMTIAGRVGKLDLSLSGTGSLSGSSLDAGVAVVRSSGVGSVTLGKVGRLDATMSGVGSLTVASADHIVRQKTSGIGSIQIGR